MPGGSNILHTAAVRIRVIGQGNLDVSLFGYNSIDSQDLVAIAMTNSSGREMNRLANFTTQMTRIRLSTNEINEIMQVSSIIIFMKPLWSDYPG